MYGILPNAPLQPAGAAKPVSRRLLVPRRKHDDIRFYHLAIWRKPRVIAKGNARGAKVDRAVLLYEQSTTSCIHPGKARRLALEGAALRVIHTAVALHAASRCLPDNDRLAACIQARTMRAAVFGSSARIVITRHAGTLYDEPLLIFDD